MYRICLFLLISLFIGVSGLSQARITVLGAEDDALLAGASIRVAQARKTIHLLANEKGQVFLQEGFNGQLQLSISFAGYHSLDTLLKLSNGDELQLVLQPLQTLLQPVEVKSIRAASTAPFTAVNISKPQIVKNNLGQDIPFLLNQTANVVVNSDAGNGIGYTGIRIRGTDATRINMTINGIPYNDAESQGLFFVNLPDLLSSVSSVQVQRGVGTSSNGAGAFGATMNFSTHEYNPDAYAELNNSFGSFNTWKNTVKLGSGLFGKRFTVDARLSNITSDGYIDRARTDLQSAFLSAAWWGDKSSIKFNAILGREKTYQAWYGIPQSDLKTNRRANYAGTEKPGEPYENETDNYWQNHYQLFYNAQLPNNWQLSTALYLTTGRGYFEQYKANQFLSDYALPPALVGNVPVDETDLIRRLWLKNKLFGQTFSLIKKQAENEWTIGGGWSHYPGQHFGEVISTTVQPDYNARWYDFDAKKSDINIYTKYQRKLNGNWRAFADVQYRYVNYSIDGFRNNPAIDISNTWNFLNPKAGVYFSKNNWTGYLSYAMANKEPNRDDFEAGVNEQPRREQLHDIELNVSRRQWIKGLNTSLTFYYMYYRDQLVLTGKINDVGAYARINLPKSYRTGIELEADYNWPWGKLQYGLALSRNKAIDFTEFVDDYDNGGQLTIAHGNTDLSFSPGVVQNATLSIYPVKKLTIDWMNKYVGKQYFDNTTNNARSLDAFMVNDARVSYVTGVGKWIKELRLVFQINNVFNSLYEPNGYTFSYIYGGDAITENYFYPMATRNFMAAVNIRL